MVKHQDLEQLIWGGKAETRPPHLDQMAKILIIMGLCSILLTSLFYFREPNFIRMVLYEVSVLIYFRNIALFLRVGLVANIMMLIIEVFIPLKHILSGEKMDHLLPRCIVSLAVLTTVSYYMYFLYSTIREICFTKQKRGRKKRI